MKEIKTINELNEVIKQDGLIIIKISGSWCIPCRVLTQSIEDIQPEYLEETKVTFYEVDVDNADQELIDKFNVMNVPILLFFKEGLQVDKVVGNIPKTTLIDKIETNRL